MDMKRRNEIKKTLLKLMAIATALGTVFIAGTVMAAESGAVTQTMDLNVNEIAVIKVSMVTVPTFTITAPATGGLAPVDDSDDTTYAQYTSVVGAGKTRTITAQMSAAATVGTQLMLTATVPVGKGVTGGEQILTDSTPQTIVTGIGSCATGSGATDGVKLTYSLEVTDVTALVAGEQKTPEITLTLTDAR